MKCARCDQALSCRIYQQMFKEKAVKDGATTLEILESVFVEEAGCDRKEQESTAPILTMI